MASSKYTQIPTTSYHAQGAITSGPRHHHLSPEFLHPPPHWALCVHRCSPVGFLNKQPQEPIKTALNLPPPLKALTWPDPSSRSHSQVLTQPRTCVQSTPATFLATSPFPFPLHNGLLAIPRPHRPNRLSSLVTQALSSPVGLCSALTCSWRPPNSVCASCRFPLIPLCSQPLLLALLLCGPVSH